MTDPIDDWNPGQASSPSSPPSTTPSDLRAEAKKFIRRIYRDAKEEAMSQVESGAINLVLKKEYGLTDEDIVIVANEGQREAKEELSLLYLLDQTMKANAFLSGFEKAYWENISRFVDQEIEERTGGAENELWRFIKDLLPLQKVFWKSIRKKMIEFNELQENLKAELHQSQSADSDDSDD